jgi:hypothetical protein
VLRQSSNKESMSASASGRTGRPQWQAFEVAGDAAQRRTGEAGADEVDADQNANVIGGDSWTGLE